MTIDRDDPFRGRSILDSEALRVLAENELDTVKATHPGSPSIEALEAHLARVADEIRQRGQMGS
jgi:hypothetical protein